jgi:hypothetical protein
MAALTGAGLQAGIAGERRGSRLPLFSSGLS